MYQILRLTNHAKFWHDIGTHPWVIGVIEQGYSLLFADHEEPSPAYFLIISLLFSISLLLVMESRDCIHEVEHDETHIISHLRLTLDLRYLNSLLSVPKFR